MSFSKLNLSKLISIFSFFVVFTILASFIPVKVQTNSQGMNHGTSSVPINQKSFTYYFPYQTIGERTQVSVQIKDIKGSAFDFVKDTSLDFFDPNFAKNVQENCREFAQTSPSKSLKMEMTSPKSFTYALPASSFKNESGSTGCLGLKIQLNNAQIGDESQIIFNNFVGKSYGTSFGTLKVTQSFQNSSGEVPPPMRPCAPSPEESYSSSSQIYSQNYSQNSYNSNSANFSSNYSSGSFSNFSSSNNFSNYSNFSSNFSNSNSNVYSAPYSTQYSAPYSDSIEVPFSLNPNCGPIMPGSDVKTNYSGAKYEFVYNSGSQKYDIISKKSVDYAKSETTLGCQFLPNLEMISYGCGQFDAREVQVYAVSYEFAFPKGQEKFYRDYYQKEGFTIDNYSEGVKWQVEYFRFKENGNFGDWKFYSDQKSIASQNRLQDSFVKANQAKWNKYPISNPISN